jgi:hypothetical protein
MALDVGNRLTSGLLSKAQVLTFRYGYVAIKGNRRAADSKSLGLSGLNELKELCTTPRSSCI